MKNSVLKSIIIFSAINLSLSCNSTNRLINKNQSKMFTTEQIKEKLSKVKTGADFPQLATNLKDMGVTCYETKMEDGRSLYHGQNGFELLGEPNYELIQISGKVNLEQLKADIRNHQNGNSDYFQISRQCANNGIDKWAVCLITMTCTYIDKAGNKVWVETIPDGTKKKIPFTIDQIKEAHGKVKSGVDFPAYIKDIRGLGVTRYETYVADGHTDYHGNNNNTLEAPPKYDLLLVADVIDRERFKNELKAHQQGKTDFPTFIKMCATVGIEKWQIRVDKMTCTYYDKKENEILVEKIPQ